MSTVVFAILVLVSSPYRPVVENLGCPVLVITTLVAGVGMAVAQSLLPAVVKG
jgi:hypothetical protein